MKKLTIFSLLLWLITIGVGVYFFVGGKTVSSPDGRRAIVLTPDEKNMVLGEMRTILSAVNGTLKAVAKGDHAEAAKAARSAGMVMAVDGNPALMGKLPLEFKSLGMSLHADFDTLADDIDKGMEGTQIIERLGTVTDKCVSCHAGYRISEERLSN